MAGARSHTELIAWQLANELKLAVYALIDRGAIGRHPQLRDQLQRSASNAPRAIAEGFGRYLPDDFTRYLRYANGELKETCDGLQDGCDRRCFTQEQIAPLLRLSRRATKASTRLIAYLKTANAPGEPRRRRPSAPREWVPGVPGVPGVPRVPMVPQVPVVPEVRDPLEPREPPEPKAPSAPLEPPEPMEPMEPMD
jgi:four helix bundle protein